MEIITKRAEGIILTKGTDTDIMFIELNGSQTHYLLVKAANKDITNFYETDKVQK